ncbi:MAG TPA: SpoIIE family protein phosphatase, partial [Verrucomicrobiota bacterium]|nr:SpoIIE family protein phosphatase [Verrucomicrobiota bacterium]
SLPDGAGLANIALLKAQSPRVPIMVVGDTDDETIAVEAMQVGAQDYLVKSQITARWLLRSIRYAVERHQADVALLDAEEKYRGIFDHLVEGIFQTTPEGRYLVANMALARIYGYGSPNELMRNLTDIGRALYVKPERRAEFVRAMQESDTLAGFESQIYRKDGSVIWISENCRAVRDARGRIIYYEGTVEDITQRREAEERLRTSEALYHSLVETMPQNIFRKDVHGRYTFVNPQFCRTLGKTYDQVIGKTIFDFLPRELAAIREENDRRVMDSRQPFETIEESRFTADERHYIQVIKMPIFDADGKVTGIQGMFWDITAQKMAEERIRKANAELARSREELRLKNLQMQDELKMASEIQMAMLPQHYPVLPRQAAIGESVFQFTHRYFPSGTVGGDFFSVSELSDTEVSIFICDVAGHGVRSALVTAMIRALVEELKPLAGEPGQFLTKLNSELRAILQHTGTPLITTAFHLVADASTGAVRYANAGHPKPLHINRAAKSVATLKNSKPKSQPALGIFPDAQYETSETRLAPGDLVMLFTDGLYEVHSAGQELYTQEMLTAGVQKRLRHNTPQLFDKLLAEVREFAEGHVFDDDVCIVGMELAVKHPQTGSLEPAATDKSG